MTVVLFISGWLLLGFAGAYFYYIVMARLFPKVPFDFKDYILMFFMFILGPCGLVASLWANIGNIKRFDGKYGSFFGDKKKEE